ncbi:MAG: GNAT family N-acetyltransferase [Candidatus Magasanikbacteria bacterium]|nr:GNAT family N-acetyltransferase [Candidatus Magasanikbacteria bacterium]
MKIVKLKGPRITLVPETKKNAKFLIPWLKDKQAMRFVDHEGFGYSLKDEMADLDFVKKYDWSELHFLVFDENNQPVGAAGLELNDFHKSGEIWLLIGEKSAWGKGYGQECIKVLGDYFFKKLKYN